MVLIRVDFPRPVCPVRTVSQSGSMPIIILARSHLPCCFSHTNTHDIELETALQQLPLDLRSDTIETDMAARENRCGGTRRGGSCSHRGV